MQSATVSAAAGVAAAQAAHKLGRTRSGSSTSSNSGNGNNNSGGAAYFAAPFFTHRAGKVPAKARLDQYTAEDTEMLSVGNSKTSNRATTATTKDYAGFSLTSSSCRAASMAPTDSKPKTSASAEYGSLIHTDAELAFAQWNAKELKVSPPESPPFDFLPGDVYKDGKDDYGVAPRASKRLANLRNLATGNEPPPAMFPMLCSDILEQHGFYDATVFHPGMRLLSGLSDCTIEELSGKSRYAAPTTCTPSSLISLARHATR